MRKITDPREARERANEATRLELDLTPDQQRALAQFRDRCCRLNEMGIRAGFHIYAQPIIMTGKITFRFVESEHVKDANAAIHAMVERQLDSTARIIAGEISVEEASEIAADLEEFDA